MPLSIQVVVVATAILIVGLWLLVFQLVRVVVDLQKTADSVGVSAQHVIAYSALLMSDQHPDKQ